MKRVFSILFALALVLAFSLVATTPVAAATLTVNTGLPNTPPNYHTIQAAVNAANPAGGDTINVAAGTYTEQINITKSLTLSGAGMTNTHIVSPTPASMTIYDAFGSKSPNSRYSGHRGTNIPVVRIAASNVVFQGFHVDLGNQVFWDVLGSYPADTTYSRGVGILVDHVETVPGTPDVFTGIVIRNNKLDGFLLNDNADAIKVLGSATATVQGNTIYAYGEQGISAQGVDSPVVGQYYSTATINSNTIYGGSSGRGVGTGTGSFFGIGFWSGATGSADGNTIYNYPSYSVGGPALNVWGSRPVSFTNNHVTSDGGSVGSWGTSFRGNTIVTFSNNTIEKQDRGVHIVGASDGNPTVTMTGNTITNCNIATTIRTYTTGPVSPTVTATGNTISNCVDGVVVDQQKNGAVTLHYNSFTGTTSGHYAVKVGGATGTDSGTTMGNWYGPSTVTVDATYNWWGANDGPGGVGPGIGDAVSANVDYVPWATKTATGTGNAYLTPSAGNITGLTAVAEGTLPTTGKPALVFPHGFFSFNITGLTPAGQTVTVTITLPSGAAPTQYWKYGPTLANPVAHWYQIPMTIVGPPNVIRITLVDGGLGDDDGAADGTIVDQGAPGNPGAVGWETYPISKVRVLLPWIALLAAIVAGASLLVVRRRRAQT